MLLSHSRRLASRIQPSRFITRFLLAGMRRYLGDSRFHITHEWSVTVSYTPDEYPVVGVMDGHRQFIIAGMAGSGTGVSFNAARCLVNRILEMTDEPDDYPAEYFAPTRLLAPEHHPWPKLNWTQYPKPDPGPFNAGDIPARTVRLRNGGLFF